MIEDKIASTFKTFFEAAITAETIASYITVQKGVNHSDSAVPSITIDVEATDEEPMGSGNRFCEVTVTYKESLEGIDPTLEDSDTTQYGGNRSGAFVTNAAAVRSVLYIDDLATQLNTQGQAMTVWEPAIFTESRDMNQGRFAVAEHKVRLYVSNSLIT